jgi:hypothetical protein
MVHASQSDPSNDRNERSRREAERRNFQIALAEQAFSAMVAPGDVAEARIISSHYGRKRIASGYFDNAGDFARSVIDFAHGHRPSGAYMSLNRINPALKARACNRINEHAEQTTTDKDVMVRDKLYIDLDPVRPSGVSSTNDEHAAALAELAAVVEFLTDQGFPLPVIVGSSGNGGMAIYRTEPLPNDEESLALHQDVLAALAGHIRSDGVALDQSVANASRIVKIPGSVAAKGDHTPDRPWRIALPTVNPDAGIVSREQLETLAASARDPDRESASDQHDEPPRARTKHGSNRQQETPEASKSRARIERALTERGISYTLKYRDGMIVLQLHPCLLDLNHTSGAAILIYANGALHFKCHHDGCAGKGWADVRELLGFTRAQRTEEDPEPTKFYFYPFTEYTQRPEPDWLVQGVLTEHTLAALIGGFSTYKTFLALDLGLSIACGIPWQGHLTKQVPCAYIAAEGGGMMKRRVHAWQKHHGVTDISDFFILPQAAQLLDDDDVAGVIAALLEQGLAGAFVIIDTLARTFAGGNENAQEDMNRYVAAADRIREETGATVLILHHTNKSGEYRGSSVLPGALDTMMTTEKTADGVRIRCDKQKDFEPFEPILLKKVTVDLTEATDVMEVTCPPKTDPRIMRVLTGNASPRRMSCGRADSRRSRSSAC